MVFSFFFVLFFVFFVFFLFFFKAEDGIRDLVRSRGLGDVYKRQRQDIVQPDGFERYLRGANHDRRKN